MPTKKEIRLYGDLVYKHKISIRTIVHQLILDFFAKRRRLKKSIYRGGIPEYNTYVPPKVEQLVYLAIVRDGTVKEMIRLNESTADLLLMTKTKLVKFDPTETIVKLGMNYSNKKFYEAEESQDEKEV